MLSLKSAVKHCYHDLVPGGHEVVYKVDFKQHLTDKLWLLIEYQKHDNSISFRITWEVSM